MDVQQALTLSWIASEERMATLLAKVGGWRDLAMNQPKAALTKEISASYYQSLHDENVHYQANNWLVPFIGFLTSKPINSLVEFGTGNGRFSRAMAAHVKKVHALDWARSPALVDLPDNMNFSIQDITAGNFPACDLACSADVLEHFTPDQVEEIIVRASRCCPRQFHVVACYDDGHSHFTVMPPSAWLCLFRGIDPTFRIHSLEARRNDPRQIVCAISNL